VVARTPYSSAVRSNQARETRRAIVDAAGQLFVERGYAATTIDAVADRAGVGRKTVFSVGGKGVLLKLAWDWAIGGDDEPIPMAERPAVQAMLAESDTQRLVTMWVDMLLDVGGRVTPIAAVVLAAADVDADVCALRDAIRRETLIGATAFVSHLAGAGGLRADLSIERGADVCWALINSLLLHLLVSLRGWSRQEYGDWLARVVATTLLEPTAGQGSRPTGNVQTRLDPRRERYEALIDDRLAGHLAYQLTERLVVITSMSIEADFDGSRVADALVRRLLEDLPGDGARRVVPLSHYAAWWLERREEYASLVYDPARDDEH
jgi:AcrR family transcriptional regulator